MRLKDRVTLLINNLKKTNTMAKDAELFKMKSTTNHRQIADEFTRLDTFIEGHDQIAEVNKLPLKSIVHGYKERTGEKVSHVTNVALLSTSISYVNMYIENYVKEVLTK